MNTVILGGSEFFAPDFSGWKKESIRTESGLIFAPEDL